MGALTASIRRLTSGGFLRDVLKLAAGTVLGRAIALVALPIVTRIYAPEDFALLAVYLSLVSLVSVIACFRLEIAIPLADDDEDAVNLLALALLALFFVAGLALIAVLSMPGTLAQWLGKPEIAPYLWLVPLGIAMAGSYAAFQFWATRARRFGAIARTRIGQAMAGVATMLSLGWAGIAPLGLLLGNAFNTGAGGLSLGFALRSDRALLRNVTPGQMKAALRKYYRYPVYSTPEALFNIAGIQVPMLLIAAHGDAEAGFLLLAMQIMTAPMTLLGGSISQVYMSRAPEEFREGRLAPFTLSIVRRLVMVGTGPLILVGVLAPIVFPWIFGADWARAGEIVTWLVPWMALQFIASPVSMVMFVVGRQRAMLALTTFGACIRIGSVLYAIVAGLSAVAMFAVTSAVFYTVCCAIFILAARAKSSERSLV
ncbi:oligosaccharide flippase family protein [uncultured Shimia sp.]|uniref:lipopolysaccharide biosynthesis protein n=1 Tax=uncultured Shimia sp. TaxID=573152 RepID=UPI00262D25C0|nr:oligosaccharide flippase family protein [uncultured Shimia sp.]